MISTLGRFARAASCGRAGPKRRLEQMRRLHLRLNALACRCGRCRAATSRRPLSPWLLRDSVVLILDEPTRGVDIGAKREIYDVIDGLARAGKPSSSSPPTCPRPSGSAIASRDGRRPDRQGASFRRHKPRKRSCCTPRERRRKPTPPFKEQRRVIDLDTPKAGPAAEALAPEPFDFAKWWDRVGILVVLVALVVLMAASHRTSRGSTTSSTLPLHLGQRDPRRGALTFVILTGGIDLSVGSIVAVSGVVAVLGAMAGLPAPVAIAAGLAAGGLCGLINGALTAYLGLAPFIVTLGTMTFLRGLSTR